MPRRNTLIFILILIIFALSLSVVLPIDEGVLGKRGVRLGLDLVGGSHLVYQAQFPEGATDEEKARDMDRAINTIQSRIDEYGVLEPIIQKQEGERILVQLPGFTDIEEAKELVEKTAFLEFRMVELDEEGNLVYLSDYLEGGRSEFFNKIEEGARIFVDENNNPLVFLVRDKEGNLVYVDREDNPVDMDKLKEEAERVEQEAEPGSEVLLSWVPARGDDGTQLTGSFLAESAAVPDEQVGIVGGMKIAIEWDKEGGIIFDQIAKRLYNSGQYGSPQRALGIFLDERLISDPQIMVPSYQGTAEITSQGGFTIEYAEKLAIWLGSGALPMPLKKPPLYEEKISATLGADFIDMSVKAGLIGVILVLLFMIIYYRLPGFLAALSLIFYGALILALFKLIPVTLTLAGLGGFILSVGMAVDANVLIFERMKEELRIGRTLGAAIESGFNRAWTAIRDSNVTTFIVCGILYWLGSSIVASAPVMGFALTLFIGVAVSMFTAIVVTRTLLRLFVATGLAHRISLFSPYAGKKDV